VKVSNFFSKIKDPVLANPTLKFTGDVHVSKLYPSPLPDLFRGDQICARGRYTGHGDSAVVLEGMVNTSTRKFTYEVNFPRTEDDHEFIPCLWATRRVGYLLDEIRVHGENTELRDESDRTGAQIRDRHALITAYLIVEDEDRRRVPLAMQSLRKLGADGPARQEAAQNWTYFNSAKDGEKAVAGARYGLALKSASSPAAATADGAIEANRGLGATGTSAGAVAVQVQPLVGGYQGPARAILAARPVHRGPKFYQNDKQWVDATTQKFPNAKRQRIQFNSTEYFRLRSERTSGAALPRAGPECAVCLGRHGLRDLRVILNDRKNAVWRMVTPAIRRPPKNLNKTVATSVSCSITAVCEFPGLDNCVRRSEPGAAWRHGLVRKIAPATENPDRGETAVETAAPATTTQSRVDSVREQTSVPVIAPARFSWHSVEAEDYKRYIANLRNIACPEATIRDIITADVDKLYAPRFAACAIRRK